MVGFDARTVVVVSCPAFLLELAHPAISVSALNPMTSTGTDLRPLRTFGDVTTLQGPN